MFKLRTPSPALVVALIALFVSLSGTAVAASPIVKRALFADNAGKLKGKTPTQLIQQAAQLPGPASSAAGLVTIKTASFSLAPNGEADVIVACDGGQRAVGGGFDSAGPVLNFDTRPVNNGAAWAMYVVNLHETNAASGTGYAVCLR
jgi:hypothetical protein